MLCAQNAEDQFLLGRAYYKGDGVIQSYEQAGFWYRKAAVHGNLKAMYNIGTMYLEGKGSPKSETEGYRWIREAADKGDIRASSLCGILLCKGTGVKKNPAEGMKLLQQAAQGGDPLASARIGQQLLYNEDGSINDPNAALPYLNTAAENGSPWACGTLGQLYDLGKEVPKDPTQSAHWYECGAKLGDPLSQFAFGRRIYSQSGPVGAYPWIKLAVKGKCTAAIGLLQECESKLTSKEISRGEAEAKIIEQLYHSAP